MPKSFKINYSTILRQKVYMIQLYVVLFLVSVLFSCSKKPNNFPNAQVHEILSIQNNDPNSSIIKFESTEVELLNVKNLVNVNDAYLIAVADNDSSIFNVFSIPDLKYLYSWGKKGRGPGELLTVGYSSPINVSGNNLFFYDANLLRQNEYVVTDTSLIFKKQVAFPISEDGSIYNDIIRLDENLYVAENNGRNITKEFVSFSPGSEKVQSTFSNYPINNEKRIERELNYKKTLAGKPDASKFVAFYSYSNALKILNREGKILKYLFFEDDYVNYAIRRVNVYTTNENIYVLSFKAENESDFENNSDSIESIIEIWNWEGEQTNRFKINSSVSRIVADETHNKIYGISVDEPDRLYMYDL